MSLHPDDTNFAGLRIASGMEYPKVPAAATPGNGIALEIGNVTARPIAAPGRLSARKGCAAGEKTPPADRR